MECTSQQKIELSNNKIPINFNAQKKQEAEVVKNLIQQLNINQSESKKYNQQQIKQKHKQKEKQEKCSKNSMPQYWKTHSHNNHRQRIQWMTGSKQQIKQVFYKIDSWQKLRNWHIQNTPWVEENQINLLMKSYHNEAIKTQNINPNQQWMLSFNL